MSVAFINAVEKAFMKKEELPRLKAGMTVKLSQTIQEGEKQRTQVYQGLIIKMSGQGLNKTITVRKDQVEKIFLLHSPTLTKIEVLRQSKTRRAKLYFMRDRSGKSARLRDMKMGGVTMEQFDLKSDNDEVAVAEEAEQQPENQDSAEPNSSSSKPETVASSNEDEASKTPDKSPAKADEAA